MCAGLGGRGAEDAWFGVNLELEEAKLTGCPATLATLDLTKAFDTFVRQYLYLGLLMAGCPKQVLVAYASFHARLQVCNVIRGVAGLWHHRPRSIPQGCPLSMRFCAFILLPVVRITEAGRAIPRLLADDILLRGAGGEGLGEVEDAVGAAVCFLEDSGARVSYEKSFMLVTEANQRRQARRRQAAKGDKGLTVVLTLRDLGASLSTHRGRSHGVIKDRHVAARQDAKKIVLMHPPVDKVIGLARGKVWPKALYGIETADAPRDHAKSLQAAVADAIIGRSGQMRQAELTLVVAGGRPHVLRG